MHYALRDIVAMVQTPGGRIQVRNGIRYRLWPLLSRLARVYRQTVIRNTRVVAVVGSFGKSTTARAVSVALGLPPRETIWTNSWSSVALALLRIKRSQRHASIEVGIGAAGEMELYARMVRPDITVVTIVGSEHWTSLGTLDATRFEKSRMVHVLPASGTAVLNGDDPNVLRMRGETRARIVTFGFGETCDVRAGDVRLDWPGGTRFRLTAFGQERDVFIRLIGRHTICAALAAVAVAHVEGVPLDDALLRLESLAPTTGRMEPVVLLNGVIALRDEFKSTLETIHAALDVFAEVPARRRIVLFGNVTEALDPAEPTYRALGARVAQMASQLIVVGEGLEPYAEGARDGGMPATAVIDGGQTPQETAKVLEAILQPGDVLLIKGRRGQRLDRVRMILQGRRVRCEIALCDLRTVNCEQCPMLEKGWGGHRVVT